MRALYRVLRLSFGLAGLVSAALPAAADGADVAYSSTAKGKGCRIVQQPPPGNQEDHAPTIMHCGGTAGFAVRIEYLAAGVLVKIARGDLARAPLTLGAGSGVGPALEWRGVRAANGFRAHAAILRLMFETDRNRSGAVLAVLRVDAARVCVAAYLDATAVANANEGARTAADRIGSGFRCGDDQPLVVEPRTALVDEAAARAGVTLR